MAEKMYKIDEPIKIVYQAPNKETDLTITAEIILPGDIKNDSNFPDIILVEVLGKGVYTGTFAPDQEGEWEAIIHKPGDEGQVVKRYSVGAHNVHSVGAAIADVDADVATLDGKVVNLDGDIVVLDGKADTTHTKLDNLNTKVGELDTPPMVS